MTMTQNSLTAWTTGLALLALALCMAGCGRAGDSAKPADVAVSSTYLAAAVRDVLGADAAVDCLAGPGNCPGHFDVAPDQIARLAETKLLLRFGFQAHLDRKLSAAVGNGLEIIEVKTTAGLGVPETYLGVCAQVAEALRDAGLISPNEAEARLAAIRERVEKQWEAARETVTSRPAGRRRVMVAAHQADVARGLGLEIVATFSGAEDPGELQRVTGEAAGEAGLLVIGNVPQGPGAAMKLAGAIDGRLVMFENFPPAGPHVDNYDRMVSANVARLQAAWRDE
jgi:hypothetical protein